MGEPRNTIVDVHYMDVFAAAPGGGNPCPVVLGGDELTDGEMQALAAHYGQETGFVLTDADGGVRLRYFVPRHEMTMCVHATVAAVTVLIGVGDLTGDGLTARTGSGDIRITWDATSTPAVSVEQQPPKFEPPVHLADEIADVVGVEVDADRPIRPVSVSRAKLIVPLRSTADLDAIEPDLPALWELCRRTGTTGAYLFAPTSTPDRYGARQFPVDVGYPEDAATGVAAGGLAAYLADGATPGWHEILIDQGVEMGRPSLLRAAAFTDTTGVSRSIVTGRATRTAREQIDATRP